MQYAKLNLAGTITPDEVIPIIVRYTAPNQDIGSWIEAAVSLEQQDVNLIGTSWYLLLNNS